MYYRVWHWLVGAVFFFFIINFCCCWCCFFNCSQNRQTHGRHWRRRRWTIHKAKKKQQEEEGGDHRNKNKQAAHFQININVRNMRESSKRKWIEIYIYTRQTCTIYVSTCVCVFHWMHNNKLKRHSWVRAQKNQYACLCMCVCLCEQRALNQKREEREREWAPAAEPPQHLIKYCSMGNCCDCCLCFETSEKKSKALECTNNKKKEAKGKWKNRNRIVELFNC